MTSFSWVFLCCRAPSPQSFPGCKLPVFDHWPKEHSSAPATATPSSPTSPPHSLSCQPSRCFHREIKGLIWSPLPPANPDPLRRYIGRIWTCYVSPQPGPCCLLPCSLRFTLHSSLSPSCSPSLPPSLHLHLRIPISVLQPEALHLPEEKGPAISPAW